LKLGLPNMKPGLLNMNLGLLKMMPGLLKTYLGSSAPTARLNLAQGEALGIRSFEVQALKGRLKTSPSSWRPTRDL
jgi:hypothetical protein